MNDIIFDIIRIVIFAVFLIVSKYFIPILSKWAKEHVDEKQYKLIVTVIADAVHALEEKYKDKPGSGEKKKQLVTTYIEEYCSEHNITISKEQISLLIDAMCYAMNEAQNKTKAEK